MPVYLIPLAAVIFIVSLGAYYALRENYGVGEHIKPFTLQSISAEDYTVTGKNDQGAITALLFFTNRCPYCHMEAGEISKAYASLNIQPILIGIREPAGTAAYFAEKHGVPEEVPVLIDSDGSIFSQFDGKGVPFNVLLKDGVVVDKWSGFAPGHLAKQARAAGAENLPR
ncbi:MAG: TlpA family protein disulfide reductase [Planctomycetes bacterium]|nr:TlpA family protein disulfide reductase [Planctomycetota bacterium]